MIINGTYSWISVDHIVGCLGIEKKKQISNYLGLNPSVQDELFSLNICVKWTVETLLLCHSGHFS